MSKGKIVIREFDGEHIWGNDEAAFDIDLEMAVKAARRIRNTLLTQPIIMEPGRMPIDPEKIRCEDCRSRLERGG